MSASAAFAAAIGLLTAFDGQGSAAPSSDGPQRCLKALAPLADHAVPISENFAPAACTAGRVAPAFRYDTVPGVTRSTRAVAAGEIVPLYPEYGGDAVLPGQTLRLVVRAGAVRIERSVEALQRARPGQRLFVKSSDGEILSVRYERSAP